jgi:hypothetical protein
LEFYTTIYLKLVREITIFFYIILHNNVLLYPLISL